MAVKQATHRINASGSVQALTVDDDVIFAGLQGGAIIAYSLETYELLARIYAHEESVLGLGLSEDRSLLFSSGADSVVNVWSTQSLKRLYSLYSSYEVGDIFCVAHSAKRQVLFCGAQNNSISWFRLEPENGLQSPIVSATPGSRKHRFFDSLGPDGSENPVVSSSFEVELHSHGGKVFTIPQKNYHQYAHKSYIYTMLLAKGLYRHDREEEVLVTGGGGGSIKLWTFDTLSTEGLIVLHKFKNTDSSVLSLACRDSLLFAGLSGGTAHIYNLASLQLVQRLQVGQGDVSQIQIGFGCFLCGTSDGWVKQFNSQFTEVDAWKAQNGKILATSLMHSDSEKVLATGGNDNIVAFWDVKLKNTPAAADVVRSNDELVNTLREFVAYRSVALNPRCVTDCHEAVTFLRKRCNAFGATTTLFSPQEGVNPILLAKFKASEDSVSRPTILFYGHYDVVDAEILRGNGTSNWHADPFSVHALNGFLYGRGVTDNKGPILAAIYAAADLSQHGMLSCNVTFLLEGDEEAGSRGFRKAVTANRNQIGPVDYVLLSNSYWLDDHIPCLTFGMRGVVHATVTILSNKPDLHSGMDGKSVQHEPLKDLTVLMGILIGETGTNIMVPGFYDAIDQLTDEEVQSYSHITSALHPGHPEIKDTEAFSRSLMQRWRYPNLTIHNIQVPESKTAVTIAGSAKATLSIRIVPSQTAEEIASSLVSYLETSFQQMNSTNMLNVTITAQADPWLANIHSAIYETLKSALTEVWSTSTLQTSSRSFPSSTPGTSTPPVSSPQKRPTHRRASSLKSTGTFTADNIPRKPLFIREGGSIPAITFLEKEFDAPAAMFPMGQASDNAHLDNERIRVENLYKGREVFKKVFSSLHYSLSLEPVHNKDELPNGMPRSVRAAGCVSQSITNSTLSSIWISDALLADTYRRFACQNRRHGSNVPGPLEARRRAAKRRNTNLAHTQSSSPPIDPALWLSNHPQEGWWKSSTSPADNRAPSKLLPAWLFGASNPSRSTPTRNGSQQESLGKDPFQTEDMLARNKEAQLQLKLQDCKDVAEVHHLLQVQNIDLRISFAANAMILTRVIELDDCGSSTQLANYLTDPIFHPPGTQNHKTFMDKFKQSTYNAEIEDAVYRSLCKATRLGLISPGAVQGIIEILLDQQSEPAAANVILKHESVAGISLALLRSLDTSGIFRVQDLSPSFVQDLCSQLIEHPPSAATLELIQFLRTRFAEQSIVRESELIIHWIRKHVSDRNFENPQEFVQAILGVPVDKQPRLILHISELLVQDCRNQSYNEELLRFWYEVLSSFKSEEVGRMFTKKDDIINFRFNSLSNSNNEASVVVSAWVILNLHYERDSYRSIVPSLNLGSFGFEEVFSSRNRLDLLSQIMVAVSRYPLPHRALFLDRLQRLPDPRYTRAMKNTMVETQIQAINNSIFSKLGDDKFYALAKGRLSDALVEFCESVNSDPEVFKHLARALIHKNRSNFKLIMRMLKHNLALKNALSQSHARGIDYRTTTARDVSNLSPESALDLINHFAVSFALSQVISARSALIKVYWCYIFLHRYGAPIQPPITRALWYAGVTRYGLEGCPTTQLRWITNKVREVEGKQVANMLLWSSQFRTHQAKTLENMDWNDKEFSKLKARTETMHPRFDQDAVKKTDNDILEMLETEESGTEADHTILMPWEENVAEQNFAPMALSG